MAIPSSCGSRIWFQCLRIHLLSRICIVFFSCNWRVLAGYPISACPLSVCPSVSLSMSLSVFLLPPAPPRAAPHPSLFLSLLFLPFSVGLLCHSNTGLMWGRLQRLRDWMPHRVRDSPPLLLVACQVPRAGSGVLKMINIYPDCFYQTLYLMVCFII